MRVISYIDAFNLYFAFITQCWRKYMRLYLPRLSASLLHHFTLLQLSTLLRPRNI